MSDFSQLPRGVQALIFSFLPPQQVMHARRINRTARAAIDGSAPLVKLLLRESFGVVLPQDTNIPRCFSQVFAEVNYTLTYLQVSEQRRFLNDDILGADTRSQQAKHLMTRLRSDSAELDRWLQSDNVSENIVRMRTMWQGYQVNYHLDSNLEVCQGILSRLLSDADQGELIKRMCCQPYGINWHQDAELMTAKMAVLAFARCGAQLCLGLFLKKVRKHFPELTGTDNDLFSDLLRDAIKFGHVELVRLLLQFGMSGNAMISTSDVNPSSGVTALVGAAAGVKMYVMSVYPELENVQSHHHARLMQAFVNRMQAYQAIMRLLLDANGVANENRELRCLSSQVRADSIGLGKLLHHFSQLSPKDFATTVFNDLLIFFSENKEQELSPALRVKVTTITRHTLSLLMDAATLQPDQAVESEVKRRKH